MIPWVPRPTRGKAALGPQTTTQRTWRRDLSTLKTRKVACKPEIWIAPSGYRALDVNLEIPEGEEVKLAPQSRCRPRFLFARYQFARGSHKTKAVAREEQSLHQTKLHSAENFVSRLAFYLRSTNLLFYRRKYSRTDF